MTPLFTFDSQREKMHAIMMHRIMICWPKANLHPAGKNSRSWHSLPPKIIKKRPFEIYKSAYLDAMQDFFEFLNKKENELNSIIQKKTPEDVPKPISRNTQQPTEQFEKAITLKETAQRLGLSYRTIFEKRHEIAFRLPGSREWRVWPSRLTELTKPRKNLPQKHTKKSPRINLCRLKFAPSQPSRTFKSKRHTAEEFNSILKK
ncbi:MAG: hypothetical protein ABN482_09800 [Corticimicrobacter sp.]|uniref:hypothetical protein n=1 Tax=Corticimicrobacter sp. TaxID=2678536 RepID=UPI0032DBEEBD